MDDLRYQVKLLKACQGITYKEISSYLDIKQKSFYSWLNGQYDFSYDTEKRLRFIIETLKV